MGTIHRRSARGVAAAVVLIAALTACGPGAQTASTTSDPSASPTPTFAMDPEDLLQLAVDNMLDARFTVSTDGTPYLVRVELTQTNEAGLATADMRFSDFGMITGTISAPSGEIVELQ